MSFYFLLHCCSDCKCALVVDLIFSSEAGIIQFGRTLESPRCLIYFNPITCEFNRYMVLSEWYLLSDLN